MVAIAYAAMQIIPTVVGLKGNLDGQIGTPLMAAGKKAGTNAGKAAIDGLQAELGKAKLVVEKISGQIGAARQKEADAAGKVRVAEAQLATLREKGVTDAGKLAAATEKVATAQRKHETAAKATATASTALKAAEDQASAATTKLATESDKAKTSVGGLGGAAEVARSGLGATAIGITAVATSIVTAATGLLTIGSTFADVRKTVTFQTGATGEALDGMMDSVKNIGTTLPKSFDEIGGVLSKLAQRTALTGEPLETLTKQVLKVNGVMGQDTDINQLTGAFAAFGVEAGDTSAVFDDLFRVSRSTGVGINELTAAAIKGAPQFQQFGFSLAESAGLMGSLDKAGINSDAVLTGLNKSMVNFAKAGRDPKEALTETIGAIQDFTKSGNDAGAIDMASKLFGTKGAGQFVNAVKAGAITVEGLTAAADTAQSGILDAGGAIPSLSSAWTLFKNNVMVALEPIATRVFKVFIDGLTWFRGTGVTAIKAVVGAFSGLLDGGMLDGAIAMFTQVKDGLTGITNILFKGDFTGPIFGLEEDSSFVNWLFGLRESIISTFNEVKGGVTAFVAAFRDGGDEITSSGFAGFLEGLGVQARNLYDVFQASILPALQQLGAVALDVGSVVLPIVWNAFTTGVSIIGGVAGAIGNVVKFFTEHKDIATVLATVIGGVLLPSLITFTATLVAQGIAWVTATASAVAYNVIGTTLSVATKVWAAGQWLLNAALNANPIGLIIGLIAGLVAGVVLAYQHSETFRNIVQGAWEGIQTAISFAWNSVIKPVFGFFVEMFNVAKDAVLGFWHNAIEPAFQAIGFVIQVWWAAVQIIFQAWKIGVTALGDAAMWLWNNAIVPAFNGVSAAISFVWNSGVLPIFNAWKVGVTALGDGAMWLYNNAITPAFNGVKTAAEFMWSGVTTVFDWFTDGLKVVGDGAMWLWNNAITPAWEGIKSAIGSVVDFLQPLWNRFTDGLGAIGDMATRVGQGMKDAFSGVVEVIKKPIHAVGRLLSSIPEKVPGITIPGAGAIRDWGNTMQALKTGGTVARRDSNGVLSGPGTGTSDSIFGVDGSGMPIVRVSDGEGVVKKSAMSKGGDRIIAALNAGWVPTADFLHGMMQGEFRPNNLGIAEDDPRVIAGLGLRSLVADGDFTGNLRDATGLEESNPIVSGILGARSLIRDGDYTGNLRDAFGIEESNPLIGGALQIRDWLKGLPKLAGGGVVDGMSAFVNGIYPDMTLTSSFRDGDPGYHGSGMAGDFSNGSGNTPEMLGLANAIAEKYPNSLELIHSNPAFKGNIKNGQNVGDGMSFYGASTMGEHENHVHWAMDSAPSAVPGMSSVGDDSAGMDLGTIPAPEGGLGGGASGSLATTLGSSAGGGGFSSGGSSVGGTFSNEQGAVKVAAGDATPVFVTNMPSGGLAGSAPTTAMPASDLDTAQSFSTSTEPELAPSTPIGGTGAETAFSGEQGTPEGDKWVNWAQDVGQQWKKFGEDNWREMLNTAVGVGLGGMGGGSPITVNANGQDPRAVTKVLVRSQNRRSRAMQRSGGLTR